MKKIYISDKISELPFPEVKKKFEAAEKHLKSEGWEPITPLKNGLPVESTWTEHMSEDIKILMSCDAIALLPCWRFSKGARIEHNIAYEMGMKILEIKDAK